MISFPLCSVCNGPTELTNAIMGEGPDGLTCWRHLGCAGWEVFPALPSSSPYERIAEQIAGVVAEKNKAYGDSFAKSEAFLRLLFPDGIKPERYGDVLTLVRIWDKIMRIATDADAFGESPYSDLAGYCLLALAKREAK